MAMTNVSQSTSLPFPWQLSAWKKLQSRLNNGTLPHALLITGVSGAGKRHFAQALAARVLCRNPEAGYACGRCAACRQLAAAAHPDYHLVTIPEAKTQILVDQIRELSQTLALTSQHSGWKIAVLTPADAMNTNAANSLLKTLEEPTAATLLLLITARPARLPATIRSRCQMLRINTPDTHTAVEWLNQRKSRPDWLPLLGIAGGGPLLALELADNELMQERLHFYQMLVELRSGRRNPIALAADASRKNPSLVLRLLQTWTADLITLATTHDPNESAIINIDALPLLQNASMGLNLRALHAFLSCINEAMKLSSTPVNAQSLLEGLFMEWSEGLLALNATPLAAGRG